MKRQFTWIFVFLMTLGYQGCAMGESKEIVILLPGRINGEPLVLAETSSSNISINQDLVPSVIMRVWWNENIIVTENHPMKPRNKFPGDQYQAPDRTQTVWYLLDTGKNTVLRFDDREELNVELDMLGTDPDEVSLLRLRDAQRVREKELGFEFSAESVNRFLRSGGKP